MDAIVILLLAALAAPAHGADANAGQVQAASCAGCHGLHGANGPNPMAPALAGQHYEYLVKQIKDFRSGRRASPMMTAMVGNMSDTNIEHVALWYSTLPPPELDGPEDTLGRDLYLYGDVDGGVVACAICHGEDARGRPEKGPTGFPALRGQTVAYTTAQLNAFANGTRANDFGHMMGNIAGKLSKEQIDAMARYLAYLPPDAPATPDPEEPPPPTDAELPGDSGEQPVAEEVSP